MAVEILDSSQSFLKKAQGKITYLGEQTGMIKTVVFSSEGHVALLDRFVEFQEGKAAYANDDVPENTLTFSVAPEEFSRMLSGVKDTLKKPDVGEGAEFLSFCVVRETSAGVEGREFKINYDHGQGIYRALIGALEPGNDDGREALETQQEDVYPGA